MSELLDSIRASLKASDSKEALFRRVASFLPRSDPRYRMIEKAYDLGLETFANERREGGEMYHNHLHSVCIIQFDRLRIRDADKLASGLLHDTTEHNHKLWPIERIRVEFNENIALWQDYLSKPSEEEYPDEEERLYVYHGRFKYAPRAFFEIKLPDRFHNTLTLWNCPLEKIKRKVQETERYYLPYAEEHGILFHEICAALDEIKTTKLDKSKKSWYSFS
jgi:(p)ppGpp synthase/HD superfamily hydrolase